jgi:hypothetical protein
MARVGRGLLGSLRSQVDHEIRGLARENRVLRRARYSLPRRLIGRIVGGRSVWQFFFLYGLILALSLVLEWAGNRYFPDRLPGYPRAELRDFLKDVGSYLIAAQIGILAIVSVAVGVVTLLSDRSDGSSVNTDIRLYYVESYSYELAVSGVALLVILTLQLFWPLQHLLHVAGFGGKDYAFKLFLSAFHATWFTFNLALFLQFITTTLRFVEPSTRETLRERYCANVVIPRDAKNRVIRALYLAAPTQIFGKEALEEGPYFAFGHSLALVEATIVEVEAVFPDPRRLQDVWLRPLEWVMRRWQSRARKLPRQKGGFGRPVWGGQLAIGAAFDGFQQGRSELLLRRDGPSLTPFEKWVVRRCLRFGRIPAREQDLPTPENFLEQLIDKVVKQIDDSAATGFKAALAETIKYHSFILAAQNTKDDSGHAFNFAEIGGFFTRPDTEWVHEYRRAFFAAAAKIGSDTAFIDRMSNVAARLVPDDAFNFSPRVLQRLLDLGVFEVIALEDWLTKRAVVGATSGEAGASTALTGSDKRAYEDALIGMVGGWETLLQNVISSFGLERRPGKRAPGESWTVFSASFPVLQTHLNNTAYFFAASVWNDDALGASRFSDLLLRWLQPFYANLQSSYLFENAVLFTPDLLVQDWASVRTALAHHVRFSPEQMAPGPVSGLVLWEAHADVVCLSGLVALHWYATRQQPSETAREAALLTLGRKLRASEGSVLTEMQPKTTFRLLFEFWIRYGLNPRFVDTRYSAALDELVRYLTRLATPRMVSGRIYGGFGIDGVDTLRSTILGAMAACLPEAGDDGISKLTGDLKDDPLFACDKTVRTFIWTMLQMSQYLADAQSMETYERAAKAMKPDIDLPAATERLRAIFDAVVDEFRALRKERLRVAPLDESRMDAVRAQMTEGLLSVGPWLQCFQYAIERKEGHVDPVEAEFGAMDKGSFVTPEMSELTFSDLPKLFVDVCRNLSADKVWRSLYGRPKKKVRIDISKSSGRFWKRAIAEASGVGPAPILIAPFDPVGQEIFSAIHRMPGAELSKYEVVHEKGVPSGGGVGYQGTIEGIRVYAGPNILTGKALLCSSEIIRSIRYGIVHGENVADFEFVDSDDPANSRVRVKFAQEIEWLECQFVEFDFEKAKRSKGSEDSGVTETSS